jgi:hypothetical protein
MRVSKIGGALLIGVLTTVTGARAVDRPFQIEGAIGWYMPSDLEIERQLGPVTFHDKLDYDDTMSYGARFGYRFSDPFGAAVTWSYVDMDAAASGGNRIGCSTCDFNVNFFDFSGEWYPGGHDWAVYAGAGWMQAEFGLSLAGESNDRSFSDDTFTWHVGTGYTWRFGDSGFYLRPDARIRFLQLDRKGQGKYDSEDPEFRLGVGWEF